MEDDGATPHGLDKVTSAQLLGFVQDNGFNAIRLPISLEFALNLTKPITCRCGKGGGGGFDDIEEIGGDMQVIRRLEGGCSPPSS